MNKHFTLLRLFIVIPALCGCSINISSPQQNTIGTPSASGKDNAIPWAGLKLSGRLIYPAAVIQNEKLLIDIDILDFATGNITTIFQTPDDGWLDSLTVSPDGKQLIFSYSPPSKDPFGGVQALYAIPVDGSIPPKLFFTPASTKEIYSQPDWSPDGKFIYFSHVGYQSDVIYELMRVEFPNGTPQVLASHASWPRVSADGTRIVYVTFDPEGGTNHLFIANADGTDAHEVQIVITPTLQIIDAPILAADGQSIFFSTPVGVPASPYIPNWVDKVLGITVAKADGALLSDWWSVPVTGGKPIQLTHLQTAALSGTYSPDKQYIASYSADGIFVMQPDGTGVTKIVSDTGGITGTVSWIR